MCEKSCLASSFGFTNPVLIDDAGEIIAGHGRVEAAKLLDLSGVPALRCPICRLQKSAYVLADNRLAEEAGWDREILAIAKTEPRRRLVAQRYQLVRHSTRLKNEVRSILHTHLIPKCPHADLFNARGRAWLAAQPLPDDERAAVGLRHEAARAPTTIIAADVTSSAGATPHKAIEVSSQTRHVIAKRRRRGDEVPNIGMRG